MKKNLEQKLREWLLNQIDFTSRCQNSDKQSCRDSFRGEQRGYIDTLNELNELVDEIKKEEKKND